MRALILFISIIFIAIGCHEIAFENEGPAKSFCGVTNPINNLDWLREEVEAISSQSYAAMDVFVISAVYQGQVVFFIDICCPVCNVAPPEIRNCQGQSLGRLGDSIAAMDVVSRSILWRTDNNVCTGQ